MKHKWSEKVRSPDGHSSRKVCERDGCEIICVSRHETDERGWPQHWKEWFCGTEKIQVGGNTPACKAVEVAV
ncbi:cytochrome C [Bradyrhizobium sp. Arg816]|uniref:cytochrome C n=1 Tax=Bradyrhizobium sp. Arg816 TaxID=2998491 RepID=UPI00249DF585|nr:cytochrome C [Bradyrhizobium sp. Arg816]MDI3559587.1 cytochrome C [Bradyrhizobium sp. Arg816]